MSPGALALYLPIATTVVSVIVLGVGAILLFRRGQGRSALPGVGFTLVGIGILIPALLSVSASLDLMHVGGPLLQNAIRLVQFAGWILVIVALARLRRSSAARSADPSAPPGPGYDHAARANQSPPPPPHR